jgi:hypothetical protein
LYEDVSLEDALIFSQRVKNVEFKVVGIETWESNAPISSQEGFGLVHASKM